MRKLLILYAILAFCFSTIFVTSTQIPENNQATEQVVTPPPHVDDIVIVPPLRSEATPKQDWFDSGWFTGALVLANLTALIILGIMGYTFYHKKPDEFEEQHVDDKNFEEVTTPREYY